MTGSLLEELDENQLNSPQLIDRSVAELSATQITDLAARLSDSVHLSTVGQPDDLFSFVPNSSIGASFNRCGELQCRLRRADDLGRFAALWADAIYLPFFPARFMREDEDAPDIGTDWIRNQFANDLKVIGHLRPVIEAGLIRFFSGFGFCATCHSRFLEARATDESVLQDAERQLRQRFTKGFSAEVAITPPQGHQPGGLTVCVSGPDEVIPHGSQCWQKPDVTLPNWLPEKLRQRVKYGQRVRYPIPVSKVTKVEEIHDAISLVISDISMHRLLSRAVSASYLTDRRTDASFLDALHDDDETSQFNGLLRKYLSFQAPVFRNVDVSELVDFRRSEDEAFVVYRDTIRRLVNERVRTTTSMTESEARDIFRDEVEPALHKMDARSKSVRLRMSETFGRNVVITGTTLGIGLAGTLSSLFPGDAGTLVTALGGYGLGREVLDAAVNALKPPDDARSQDLYFLWKLKAKARN